MCFMGKKVAFIGNFMLNAPSCFSTECERVWSLEQLNHEVITFQENETTSEQLLEAMNDVDLLIYSHTHDPSYIIDGLKEVFNIYKANGVPTASVHLDRWAGLEREKDVGQEATWFTEYIFMADGSPEAVELYKKHNLNWYWLKPGVVERACYIAETQSKIKHEIVFTGSRNYHKEYDFRPRLVDWLKRTYGRRFEHYGNDGIRVIRQSQLNNLYAATKIVIGDSCFGGRPRYWSDRVPEVIGRGGFLLHPKVEGLDIPGFDYYEKENLYSLKEKIDYWLLPENQEERKKRVIIGHEHVKKHDTYTNRSQELLDVVFGEGLQE